MTDNVLIASNLTEVTFWSIKSNCVVRLEVGGVPSDANGDEVVAYICMTLGIDEDDLLSYRRQRAEK